MKKPLRSGAGSPPLARSALPTQEVLQKLQGWWARCDPNEPLDPKVDERFVPLDEPIEGRRVGPRGQDPVAVLSATIRLCAGAGASCQLFSGFPGTGKSTALNRLKAELESQGYVVLLADASDYLSLSAPLEVETLLLSLATALEEHAVRLIGESDWKRQRRGLFASFLEQLGVSGIGAEWEIGKIPLGFANLKLAIRRGSVFQAERQKQIRESLATLQASAQGFMDALIRDLRAAKPGAEGVVFLFDSLEKLDAGPTLFTPIMESVRRLLSAHADALRIPGCHTVYTVPPYVQVITSGLRGRFDEVTQVLPALRVQQQGMKRSTDPEGVALALKVLSRRVDLRELFGDREDLAERLALSSGGHLRMLLAMSRDLIKNSLRYGLPVQEVDLEEVERLHREPMQKQLYPESQSVLAHIAKAQALTGLDEGEQIVLAKLMKEWIVLAYRNGQDWFDVHPLLLPEVQRSMRAVRRRGTEVEASEDAPKRKAASRKKRVPDAGGQS